MQKMCVFVIVRYMKQFFAKLFLLIERDYTYFLHFLTRGKRASCFISTPAGTSSGFLKPAKPLLSGRALLVQL